MASPSEVLVRITLGMGLWAGFEPRVCVRVAAPCFVSVTATPLQSSGRRELKLQPRICRKELTCDYS